MAVAARPVACPPRISSHPRRRRTEDALYQAAKQEGKVVWWTAHYAQSAADAVRDAFVAKYPGIEVEFIRQTAQVIYQRLTQNLQAGVREVDVFASTDEARLSRPAEAGSARRLHPARRGAPARNLSAMWTPITPTTSAPLPSC